MQTHHGCRFTPLRFAMLAVGALWLLPGTAWSQSRDATPFPNAPTPHALLHLHGAGTLEHLQMFVGLGLGYANDPAVASVGNRAVARLIQHRAHAELALGIGLFSRFELALGLPIYLRQTSADFYPPGSGTIDSGAGDLRIVPKVHLWAGHGFGLAAVAELTLPTGRDEALMGDGGVTVAPRLIADYTHRVGLHLAFNVAYRIRAQKQLVDLPLDDELLLGIGVEQRLGLSQLSAGAELDASLGFGTSNEDDALVSERKTPVELAGFLRWRGKTGLLATFAVGAGLSGGYGAADLRVLLSIGWTVPTRDPSPPRPATRPTTQPTSLPATAKANDGRAGKLAAADFDKQAAADPDPDGDGIPNSRDKCPNEPEDFDGFEDTDGCPDPDNDRDGIPDALDKCPNEPETINGVDDDDGCPDKGKGRVVLSGTQLKLLDAKIFFRSGSDVLEGRSEPILREVASALKAYWVIRKLRIEGHTDNRGDKEMNVDLSERRARRVRAFLISRGVAAHRLVAKGYGPKRPIAKNRTGAGRAKNRRVAFEVLEKADPNKFPGGPKTPSTSTPSQGGAR